MKQLISGRKRKQIRYSRNTIFGDVLFIGGILIMCIMIILPMNKNAEKVNEGKEYVSVMSESIYSREELAKPDKPASGEEWSLFDAIGELFAELIFGEEK